MVFLRPLHILSIYTFYLYYIYIYHINIFSYVYMCKYMLINAMPKESTRGCQMPWSCPTRVLGSKLRSSTKATAHPWPPATSLTPLHSVLTAQMVKGNELIYSQTLPNATYEQSPDLCHVLAWKCHKTVCFDCLFWDRVSQCSSGCPGPHRVPLPPKCWD